MAAVAITEQESVKAERDRRIAEKLRRELGSEISALLVEHGVNDIMLNPDGRLWVDRIGKPQECIGRMSSMQAESLMTTIASFYKGEITREHPYIECEIPFDGSRFEGAIPPIVAAPQFTIRCRPKSVFTLDDYERIGAMTQRQGEVIREAVLAAKNIVVVGSTGSGKTTLTNAIIDYMAVVLPDERLLVLEDTVEIQCRSQNAVQFRTSDTVDLRQLIRIAMRSNPTRILVGEVRDGAALEVIKVWNTGHRGGVTTIHADDADSALPRLEELVAEATSAPKQRAIARTIGLIVHIAVTSAGRRVQEVRSVEGFDSVSGNYITKREA